MFTLNAKFSYVFKARFLRTSTTICRGLEALFDKFADSWNAVREKVKGYECRELQIPIMDRNCPLAMCLVEPRDQGIYIVALFEYLRSIQNGFLDELFTVEGLNLQNRLSDTSPPSVRVQNCKVSNSYLTTDLVMTWFWILALPQIAGSKFFSFGVDELVF